MITDSRAWDRRRLTVAAPSNFDYSPVSAIWSAPGSKRRVASDRPRQWSSSTSGWIVSAFQSFDNQEQSNIHPHALITRFSGCGGARKMRAPPLARTILGPRFGHRHAGERLEQPPRSLRTIGAVLGQAREDQRIERRRDRQLGLLRRV